MNIKYLKYLLFIPIFGILTIPIFGQYSLEQAIIDSKSNHSTDQIIKYNNSIVDLRLENISKSFYPKISFTGQATYQSAVTELPIELPGITINALNKDQYRIQGEIRQLLYDGGAISKSKEIVSTSNQLSNLETEIENENIRGQVINLYFGILEIKTQASILNLKKENMEANIVSLESGIKNGILQNSELFELQAAIIVIDQEITKLNSIKSNIIKSLNILTNADIDERTEFEIPSQETNLNLNYNNKLIFKKMDLQKDLLAINQSFNETQSLPKAAFFVNFGYANPALNFLQNSFQPYAIGGVQLSWSLNNLYTKSTERQILKLSNNLVDERKNQITKNLDIQKEQYLNDQLLLENLTSQDEALLELRTKIRENAESKLKNGVLTSDRLIMYINEENEVKEKIALRKLQIIKNQYLLDHLTGNYSK